MSKSIIDFEKIIQAIDRYFFKQVASKSLLKQRSIRHNLDILQSRLMPKSETFGSLTGSLYRSWFTNPIKEKSVGRDSFYYSIGSLSPYSAIHEIGGSFNRTINVTNRMRRFFFLYLKRANLYQRELAKGGKTQWIQKVNIPPRYYMSQAITQTYKDFVKNLVDTGIEEIPAIRMQIHDRIKSLFENIPNAKSYH